MWEHLVAEIVVTEIARRIHVCDLDDCGGPLLADFEAANRVVHYLSQVEG